MLPKLVERLDDRWDRVTEEVVEMVKLATEPAARLRQGVWGLPRVPHHILLQPYTGEVHISLDKSASDATACAWEKRFRELGFDKLSGAPMDVPPAGFCKVPWLMVKRASDPLMSFAARALNYQPSFVNQVIGGPSPLAATLSSGVLGAGLGYLGGTAAEQFLPEEHFERGTLRRNAALLGGLLGAAPGALWGLSSQRHHPDKPGWRAWLSSWPYRRQDMREDPIKKAADALQALLPDLKPEDYLQKAAVQPQQPLGTGVDLMATMPMIPRDQFGRVVLQDPNTPRPIQAATIGLVNTASMAAGSPYVSPYDIARISAGGLARGIVVGKTLGALAGLRPESQQALQQAGVWNAMLSTVVPNALIPPNSNFYGY